MWFIGFAWVSVGNRRALTRARRSIQFNRAGCWAESRPLGLKDSAKLNHRDQPLSTRPCSRRPAGVPAARSRFYSPRSVAPRLPGPLPPEHSGSRKLFGRHSVCSQRGRFRCSFLRTFRYPKAASRTRPAGGKCRPFGGSRTNRGAAVRQMSCSKGLMVSVAFRSAKALFTAALMRRSAAPYLYRHCTGRKGAWFSRLSARHALPDPTTPAVG